MLRRKPTRIELKDSDAAELDAVEKSRKDGSSSAGVAHGEQTPHGRNGNEARQKVEQRIGFIKEDP